MKRYAFAAVLVLACGPPVDGQGRAIEVGTFRLRTFPPGARVWIDGELKVESTPATLVLRAGTYRLRIQHPGAASLERDIEIVAGVRRDQTIDIPEPPPATVSVTSDVVGADVRVNGYLRGRTPLHRAVTRPGPLDLTITTPDGLARSLRADLAIAEQKRLQVFFEAVTCEPEKEAVPREPMSLPRARGVLMLAFKPDGKVFDVHGQVLGPSPLNRTMPAGKHTLLLRSDDGAFARRVTVTVEAEDRSIYRFQLGRGDEVERARSTRD